MTFDPTTNLVQFKLLSVTERSALQNWPHGWEYPSDNGERWFETVNPIWHKDIVYRGKPAPVVVSRYLNVEPKHRGFASRSCADSAAGPNRIAVLRIDTCDGVATAHLEKVQP